MKHPDSSVEYIAGHLDVGLPCDGFAKWSDSDSDDVKYVWLFISLGLVSASFNTCCFGVDYMCSSPPYFTGES